jgi:uncharacterized protein (TIGR02284 family)
MNSLSKVMKNELIDLITENGGEANDSPSIAGTLHRTWIDIKNSFTIGNTEESTIENVIFGEKAAIDAYQNAIDTGKLSEKSRKLFRSSLNTSKILIMNSKEKAIIKNSYCFSYRSS